MMLIVIAGLISAILAWVGNGWIVKQLDEQGVIYVVPVFEEILKTSMALVFQTSIFYTHFTFGALEAILDIRNGHEGFKAGIFSLVTHSIFGLVTISISQIANSIMIGVLVSSVIHILWNKYIVRLSQKVKN